MSDNEYTSFDIQEGPQILASLHERVVSGKTRIELRSKDGDSTSVIISKAELESLENALAILSNTGEVRAICNLLKQLAAAAMTTDLSPTPTIEPPEAVALRS